MIDERYSLMRGGLLYRISRAGPGPHRRMAPAIAGALLLIVVLPLVLATWRAGTLLPGRVDVPLSLDYTVWGRFVLAMPLLVLAAPVADERLWRAIKHLSGLVETDDRARFDRALERFRRVRDSSIPELVLFVVAVSMSFAAPPFLLAGHSSWRGDAMGTSGAGLWLVWVAHPVFRFLAALWLWRLTLWICLLWRFSRLHLTLHAAHPDGSAGLTFLAYAQAAFIALLLAGGLLVAGTCATELKYLGADIKMIQLVMAGYVVLSVALFIAPLLFMTPQLSAVKRSSLLAYGALGTDCSEEFEEKWLGRVRGGGKPILEAGDSSALADLTGVYTTASKMSPIPLPRAVLLQFIIAAGAPMIPVLAMRIPIKELIPKLASALFL